MDPFRNPKPCGSAYTATARSMKFWSDIPLRKSDQNQPESAPVECI